MSIEERKLFYKIAWLGMNETGVIEQQLAGKGALIFRAPVADHVPLILIAENCKEGFLSIEELRKILNYVALNFLGEGDIPESAIWYTCLSGKYDRILPSWFGRDSGGVPIPPHIEAYPCGNRTFTAFRTICNSLGIITDPFEVYAFQNGIHLS